MTLTLTKALTLIGLFTMAFAMYELFSNIYSTESADTRTGGIIEAVFLLLAGTVTLTVAELTA